MSHQRFLANLGRRNTTSTETDDSPQSINQNTARRGSAQVVCQRCKRFEVDLTNTSDSLNATDAELKASRQVISLLQRQLELFRVEKEGLEKLIVTQTKGYTRSPTNETASNQDSTKSEDGSTRDLLDLGTDRDQGSRSSVQEKLLNLIQTQLYSKDEEIVKLKFSLKETQNEKEQLSVQLHLLEDDLSKLKLENSLLRENLALRDQTIVSLSNEVFEQTGGDPSGKMNLNSRRQSSAENILSQTANHFRQTSNEQQHQRQISKLSDTLEAYKKTNELLGQNVLTLTDKCAQSERREMESKSQAQELEARCCQIQSKLLSLLKEIEQSTTKQLSETSEGDLVKLESEEFIQSEPVKLLIKRLLEDESLDIPLSWKQGNKSKKSDEKSTDPRSEVECDELGFYIVTGKCQNDLDSSIPSHLSSSVGSIAQKTRRARLSSKNIHDNGTQLGPVDEDAESVESVRHLTIDSVKDDEASWRLSWDEFIKDFDKVNAIKCKEFKTLLRLGVPQEYRCKIWKALIDSKLGKERQEHGSDYYQSLLEPTSSKTPSQCSKHQINPSSKQIELDLLRTLPNNKYFEAIDSPGTVRLRRVLNAFAAHKPEVGYCQGMNRLAAVALLVLPEEEAFWCLVSIIEKIMPSGYYNDLWLAQVDSNVVMDFVGQFMPTLAEHFRRNEIELSLFAWFLTIFVDGTSPALFLRLWDCFLHEGDKVMFRIALALLKMNEDALLQLNNSVSANNFMRTSVNNLTDIDGAFRIAFESINPLPGSRVRARRELHFRTMQANLDDHGRLIRARVTPVEQDPEETTNRAEEDDQDGGQNRESIIIDI